MILFNALTKLTLKAVSFIPWAFMQRILPHLILIQVFRRAVNVSSVLFQITAYELPQAEEASRDAAPTLRFIAYDPKTQMQVGDVLVFAGSPTDSDFSM